jgi:hypothetical protein
MRFLARHLQAHGYRSEEEARIFEGEMPTISFLD